MSFLFSKLNFGNIPFSQILALFIRIFKYKMPFILKTITGERGEEETEKMRMINSFIYNAILQLSLRIFNKFYMFFIIILFFAYELMRLLLKIHELVNLEEGNKINKCVYLSFHIKCISDYTFTLFQTRKKFSQTL